MYIGIIGAMEEEIQEIRAQLKQKEVQHIMGFDYYIGTLQDCDVVVVQCLEGKVNAAICTQTLLQNFAIQMVLNVGVAGGLDPNFHVGDIAISQATVAFDQDTTALGYELGYTFGVNKVLLACDTNLVHRIYQLIQKQQKVVAGVIASSDTFVTNEETKTMLQQKFHAIAVDMESASIHHVCYLQQVPFCAIRAISDTANGMEYKEFVGIAVRKLEHVINAILSDILCYQ